MFVGRPTRWGNPFRVHLGTVLGPTSEDVARRSMRRGVRPGEGTKVYASDLDPVAAVVRAVRLHRALIEDRYAALPEFDEWIAPLRGKTLVCWCLPGMPCHADTLLEYANRPA